MGSMDQYSRWPIPGSYWGEYPFGGFYPGCTQQQMNQHAFLWQNQGWGGPRWWEGLEGMRQIEMWKCDHCGSRFQEKPEKCKNCGSTDILRFDQPGRAAAQWLQQPWSAAEAMAFGPLGIPPKQLTVSEAVAEFRQEVAKIRGPRRCWLSRCWSRFLDSLDRSGYR